MTTGYVYLVRYWHKHGDDLSAYATETAAWEAAGGIVAEWYEQELDFYHGSKAEISDAVARGEWHTAVQLYNEAQDRESVEVLNMPVHE